jgi:hypothetical protein
MGRVTWNNIKTSKRFYVAIYRYVSLTLLISLLLNGLLMGMIVFKYLHVPARSYYATYGGSWPLILTAISQPNMKSTPLLADDPGMAQGVPKSIPQKESD